MNTNVPYKIPPVSLLEPNDSAQGNPGSLIRLRELIDTEAFRKISDPLTVPVGIDPTGNPVFFNIAKMPHLLITGRTGAGKSMWLHTVITSLLCKNSPDKVNLLLIDPKMTAFDDYDSLPHLISPVVQGWQEGIDALNWAADEMMRRYERPGKENRPHIVVIVDELADLMMTAPDQVEGAICRLAQMGRAVGMHLLIATQYPRPDILTVLISSNIPTRIAFAVASQRDSRCILDTVGAETLNGRGDMLFLPISVSKPIRLQGAYVSSRETERIVTFIKEHNGEKPE